MLVDHHAYPMPVLMEMGTNMMDELVVVKKAHNMPIMLESLVWLSVVSHNSRDNSSLLILWMVLG